jgi:hypothetical protein
MCSYLTTQIIFLVFFKDVFTRKVFLMNTATGQLIAELKGNEKVSRAVFSPDGKSIVMVFSLRSCDSCNRGTKG